MNVWRTPLLSPSSAPPRLGQPLTAVRVLLLLLLLALACQFFVVVPAGSRGVLLRFGAVQPQVLGEGLHPMLPLRDRVKPISLRLRSQKLRSEAASRDLQDVGFDVAVSWHLEADQVGRVYQRLGAGSNVVPRLIEPALEDGLKAVVARFRAEELITRRDALKHDLSQALEARLAREGIALDAVDLLQLDFSEAFRQAVEAKQVAEQDARRAEFEAMKAQRLAQARVFRAEGQARAQQLLQSGLTAEVLQHEAIEKWNGRLPLVMGHEGLALDVKSLLKVEARQDRDRRGGRDRRGP